MRITFQSTGNAGEEGVSSLAVCANTPATASGHVDLAGASGTIFAATEGVKSAQKELASRRPRASYGARSARSIRSRTPEVPADAVIDSAPVTNTGTARRHQRDAKLKPVERGRPSFILEGLSSLIVLISLLLSEQGTVLRSD
jgi:hypothetical protein